MKPVLYETVAGPAGELPFQANEQTKLDNIVNTLQVLITPV